MDTTRPPRLARRALRGVLVAALVLPLLAGCGSDKKDKADKDGDPKSSEDSSTTSVEQGGTPVTNPDGTPVLNPDGSPVTIPASGTQATNPDGTPAGDGSTGGNEPTGEGKYPCTLVTVDELKAAFGVEFSAPQAPQNTADADTCTWLPKAAGGAIAQFSVSVLEPKHLQDGQTLQSVYDSLLSFQDHSEAPLSIGAQSDRVSIPPTEANGITHGLTFGRVRDDKRVLVAGAVAAGEGDGRVDLADPAKNAVSDLTAKAYARF